MAEPAWEKIGIYRGGIVPVLFQRYFLRMSDVRFISFFLYIKFISIPVTRSHMIIALKLLFSQ